MRSGPVLGDIHQQISFMTSNVTLTYSMMKSQQTACTLWHTVIDSRNGIILPTGQDLYNLNSV